LPLVLVLAQLGLFTAIGVLAIKSAAPHMAGQIDFNTLARVFGFVLFLFCLFVNTLS